MEPAISFYHAALKVKWSGVLIDNLNSSIEAWRKTKPCAVWPEFDSETNLTNIMSGIKGGLDASIPLLAGDIVANLRSALDCAWMGLVRAEGFEAKHTLPIANNRKGLISTVRNSPIQTALGQAERLLVDDLRSHQDFGDGGNRALCALNNLNNWQKHNLLIAAPVSTVSHRMIIDTTMGKGNEVWGNITRGFGIACMISIAGKPTKIRHQGEPTCEVLIQGEHLIDAQPIIPTMVNFREVVTQALQAFVARFPEGDSVEFRNTLPA